MATVAIAALGDPLSFGRAALGEVIKYAQSRYEAAGETRDVHRQVTKGIRSWAEREGFTVEQAQLGLALAADVVARFGLDRDAIEDLDFDPCAVSAQVFEAAKTQDRVFWGKELHYDVAERAVVETYGALISEMRGAEPVLLPAVQALRHDLVDRRF